MISSNTTATLLVSLQCREPLSSGVPSVSANIIIAGSSPLPCGVPLSLLDILRPVTATTAQFGAAWKATTQEIKKQIVVPATNQVMRTCDGLMARVKVSFLFFSSSPCEHNSMYAHIWMMLMIDNRL
jgi:hypothetical protein